jgi:hypothetical protein
MALTALADDLWVATRSLPIFVGDIGARMTVVRLRDGSLLLHSPVALDDELRAELAALGPVHWLVGPSKVHHLFLAEYVRAYPDATLCAAPGLEEKRKDLSFDLILDDGTPEEWRRDLATEIFRGAPLMNEVVFFHPASRSLILTDLAFNVRPGPTNKAWVFHRLVGATGRFGPHRIARLGIRDRRAAWRSVQRILEWEFDRVIVSHGEVLERGGHAAFAAAFAYLGPHESAPL